MHAQSLEGRYDEFDGSATLRFYEVMPKRVVSEDVPEKPPGAVRTVSVDPEVAAPAAPPSADTPTGKWVPRTGAQLTASTEATAAAAKAAATKRAPPTGNPPPVAKAKVHPACTRISKVKYWAVVE